MSEIDELARRIREAARTGPARYVTGVTTAAPSAGWVTVDRGGGDVVRAKVPGSFRSNVVSGQHVRLSVQGSTYTVDAVLSALPAPTVAAPPAESEIDPGVNDTESDGMYLYLYGDVAGVAQYAYDIAEIVNNHGGDLNDLRDDVGWNSDDLASLRDDLNDLRATVAAIRTALIAQGHVV